MWRSEVLALVQRNMVTSLRRALASSRMTFSSSSERELLATSAFLRRTRRDVICSMEIPTQRSIFWTRIFNIFCRFTSGSCGLVKSLTATIMSPSSFKGASRSLLFVPFAGVPSGGGRGGNV